MPKKVDFERLLDPRTPPARWRAEMEKSANLRAALKCLEQVRREAAEDGIPVDDTDECRQFLFRFTVRNAATAQRLHLGDITVDRLIEDWKALMEDRFDGMVLGADSNDDDAPCDCPVCAPLSFDRERARAATADDGIDYGLLASSDAAWWVWRAEVDRTRFFKSLVERMEPGMAAFESCDEHGKQRAFMEHFLEEVSRDSDTIRALESGILTSHDLMLDAARRIIARQSPEGLEKLKKILQGQDS